MSPMISSSANSTAATGVLKAADKRAGRADRHEIPNALRRQTAASGQSTEARPAPICTDGPSRPIEWPEPMQSTPVRNLPNGTRVGITPPAR